MVQPTPKQLSRDRKEEIVEELKELIAGKPVIGILDMHNLPSKQLQQIKKEMKDFANIRMERKTLMEIAIEESDKDSIDSLEPGEAVQPAFIFSEKDPFQLYSLIQNNKTSAAAQGGEEAPDDIEIPEGDTGIGPGPMLGKLQGAGLQVQVEDGSIHVQESGILVGRGETISNEDAEILNQVGIEPLEIGLDLKVAYSGGEVFRREDLDIDTEAYRQDLEAAASGGFNLAVNTGIVNERTIVSIISKAVTEAKNLSISEGLPEEETVEEAVSYANSGAESLEAEIDLDVVEVEEGDEDESEQEENEAEENEEERDKEEEKDESGEEDQEESEEEDQKDKEKEGAEEEESSESEEETEEPETDDVDYGEIVSGTISDAKEELQEVENPDWEAALEAEKENKDRSTFKDWLEGKTE
ncbi:MAG: 50S ribosomal protein L10 [Candidatus Nanohaloarchaea archaeon]